MICKKCNENNAIIALADGNYCIKHYYKIFEQSFRKMLRQSDIDPKKDCIIYDDNTFRPRLIELMLKKATNGHTNPKFHKNVQECNIYPFDLDDISYNALYEFFNNQSSNYYFTKFNPLCQIERKNLLEVQKFLEIKGDVPKEDNKLYEELCVFEEKYRGTKSSLLKSYLFLKK